VFTGRAYGRTRGAHETCHGRHVDDSAASLLFEHLLNFVFEAEPDSLQIGVHDTVKVFLGLIDNGHPFAFNAGIVKGDVEAAKFIDSFVDQRLHIGGFRNVGFYEAGVAARGADEFGGFRSFKFAATLAPAWAKSTAVSRPMPEVPPVTTAILSRKSVVNVTR
jgi:hypothetical protein